MEKLKLIRQFMDGQTHMVIATNDGIVPEAALVGFAASDDLSLIFGTYTTTRKYKNILKNPKVAIVFGDSGKITVQYEGTVTKLEGTELDRYKEIYFKKTPSAKKYENYENQTYLKVTPSWVRYTDYNKDPILVFEEFITNQKVLNAS